MYQRHAGYLNRAFGDLDEIKDDLIRFTENRVEFDSLVGIGLSGTLVVPFLGRALGLDWAIVRKADNAHSTLSIEGTIGEQWLFVDDIVDSGRTRNAVKMAVSYETSSRYVGTFEYYFNRFSQT